MRALVLNGGSCRDAPVDELQGALEIELGARGWGAEGLVLRDLSIAPCTGCFECWTKTPGVCKTKDSGRYVARAMIRSDLVVFLTPVLFGGYAPHLKKALDRVIGLVSPFFTRVDGEVHHRERYERYPALLGVGWLAEPDSEEERIFDTLVNRNAINLHAPAWLSHVVHGGTGVGAVPLVVRAMLARIEGSAA